MDKEKAVLVIDMPGSCAECDLLWKDEYSVFCPCRHSKNTTDIYEYVQSQTKPDWCPLNPLPSYDENFDYWGNWKVGFQDCLDEILGG